MLEQFPKRNSQDDDKRPVTQRKGGNLVVDENKASEELIQCDVSCRVGVAADMNGRNEVREDEQTCRNQKNASERQPAPFQKTVVEIKQTCQQENIIEKEGTNPAGNILGTIPFRQKKGDKYASYRIEAKKSQKQTQSPLKTGFRFLMSAEVYGASHAEHEDGCSNGIDGLVEEQKRPASVAKGVTYPRIPEHNILNMHDNHDENQNGFP